MRRIVNRVISAFLQAFGLVLLKVRSGEQAVVVDSDSHVVPSFIGRSAKKMNDIRTLPIFGEVADRVIADKRTYLHYDRLYTIFGALQNVMRLRETTEALNMAEVGVFRGGGTRFIAEICARLNLNASIFSFDTFEGHAHQDLLSSEDDTNIHAAGHFSNVSLDDVKEYLAGFQNITLYKGRFQDQSHNVEKLEFAFVHLDVDIYEPTIFALDFFAKCMKQGGVIVVDDYGFSTCPGMSAVVEGFTAKRNDFVKVVQLTGQCVLVKVR